MATIFEIPDGDNIVFSREEREDLGYIREKWLASRKHEVEAQYRAQLWVDIEQAALTTPGLHESIERVIILYELSKKVT